MKALNVPSKTLNRRKFVVMAGSIGALAAVNPGVAFSKTQEHPVNWKGSALGAEASIQLFHKDRKWALLQLQKCQKEIERLEGLFSLYQPDSSIRRLNAEGSLDYPDVDFVVLLSKAVAFSDQTNGVFDVSMQPLWVLYANHFSKTGADIKGPYSKSVENVLKNIGSKNIQISPDRISFGRPEMAITLNGIAQGFITDKITSILKDAGFENVLVSLGENYAMGVRPDGTAWRAGIVSPVDGTSILRTIDLKDGALATSGGYGSPFVSGSTLNHLIDPRDGTTAEFKKSVSVIADTAVKADMVSTALSLMSKSEASRLISSSSDIRDVIIL